MASFTERYHELTKYNPHTIDKLGPVRWESQPPAFKSISSKGKIDLLARLQSVMDHLEDPGPAAGGREAARGGEAAKGREAPVKSGEGVRGRETKGLEPALGPDAGLENIARLLFFTLGLTARLSDQGGGDFYMRAAPSAGGLYPTEIYVAARNQNGLPDGIYHYHSLKSALIPVWQGSFWGDLKHYFLDHPAVESSNLILLFTGLYGRSAWRYKERAYRRILLDTGHAVGNLLEVCRHHGFDHSLMGGFLDDGLEELLFLTSKEEFPLLGVAVGPSGSLPEAIGQYPSAPPAEAIRHLANGETRTVDVGVKEGESKDAGIRDAMQIQQNSCERIRSGETLRPPIAGPCGGPPFPKPNGYVTALPNVLARSPASSSSPSEFNALKTILNRRSCRKFNGEAVTLAKLRENLAFSFRREGNTWCLAADRLEFHLVALNVNGLESGVYRFHPATLTLDSHRLGDFRSETLFMCLGQDLAAECAYALVHTADLAALAATFGDRGYRYACMDAGQIGERVNLWAVHQGFGSSGIGGYYDDQANELLDLPLSHGILYITLVGVPEEG